MALDSELSVAMLQKADSLLRPFFVHRAAEVHEALKEMKRLYKKVLPVAVIRGTQNLADIANKGGGTRMLTLRLAMLGSCSKPPSSAGQPGGLEKNGTTYFR